jgi:DNA-binding transcriptional MocR family regulator
MLSALDAFMPEFVSWSRPGGGYFVWLKLPPYLSASEVVRVADAGGVTCLAGPAFYVRPGGDNHIRLAFSYVPTNKIEEGIAKLADVIRAIVAEKRVS